MLVNQFNTCIIYPRFSSVGLNNFTCLNRQQYILRQNNYAIKVVNRNLKSNIQKLLQYCNELEKITLFLIKVTIKTPSGSN